MSILSELKSRAEGLPLDAREDLVNHLVLGLGSPMITVSDDDIDERERDMDAGKVELVSHDEFSSFVRK